MIETRKAPQEQEKLRASTLTRPGYPPVEPPYTIERRGLEDYLENVDRYRVCIEGMAAVVDMLDVSRLRSESIKRLEASDSNIPTGLAAILAVCATEMRIDIEVFRRDYLADGGQIQLADEGGIQ